MWEVDREMAFLHMRNHRDRPRRDHVDVNPADRGANEIGEPMNPSSRPSDEIPAPPHSLSLDQWHHLKVLADGYGPIEFGLNLARRPALCSLGGSAYGHNSESALLAMPAACTATLRDPLRLKEW